MNYINKVTAAGLKSSVKCKYTQMGTFIKSKLTEIKCTQLINLSNLYRLKQAMIKQIFRPKRPLSSNKY